MLKTFSRSSLFLVVLLFVSSACMKDDTLAIVSTAPVTDITSTTATSGGTIDRQDGSMVQEFGICWSAEPGPTIVDSRTKLTVNKNPTFVSTMDGLSPNTKYYVRAYSRNTAGTAYGDERSFTTIAGASFVELIDVKFENGNFKATYSVTNQLDPVMNTGVCWNLTGNPTLSDDNKDGNGGGGVFTITLPNLNDEVIFYARAFATTLSGTSYSETMVFGTILGANNVRYNVVEIGSRLWLRENLRTTHFSNGDPITEISSIPGSENAWKNVGASAFSLPPQGKPSAYSHFYNGLAVVDPRNVCPTGWHVPNQGDLNDLVASVDETLGGLALKETGSTYWTDNVSSTNAARFSALPAGIRDENGFFDESSLSARFWSSLPSPGSPLIWTVRLDHDRGDVMLESLHQKAGASVRCVKN